MKMIWRNKILGALVGGFMVLSSCEKDNRVERMVNFSENQTRIMLREIELKNNEFTKVNTNDNEARRFVSPRTIGENGELKLVPSKDWTSGFFPGVLWYLYQSTGELMWKEEAEKFTAKIEHEQWNGGTHDMGFKINCSFGNGLNLTGSEEYKEVIIQSAKTLMTRYNPTVGCIRSWDHNRDKWDYPVIIDNMMNLELLFLATKLTGDSVFYNIAITHAQTTLKNHFRDDNSSYHVIDYDTLTGEATKKNTHQGYSHGSAWSRGQAWGLYGFTMCYRETQDKTFLDQAEKIAVYMLNHPNMPTDLVPYWDFDAPGISDEPRDVSAATITASALYELSIYTNKDDYLKAADEIIKSVAENYTSKSGENYGFILVKSVGSKPGNSEISVPLSYADYYFLEALLRKQKLDHEGPQALAQ